MDGAQADELPGAYFDLQTGDQELSRPAAAHLREWLLPPQRAARRAPRADARASVHAGRRAHLLPCGPDRRRGPRLLTTRRPHINRFRLHLISADRRDGHERLSPSSPLWYASTQQTT